MNYKERKDLLFGTELLNIAWKILSRLLHYINPSEWVVQRLIHLILLINVPFWYLLAAEQFLAGGGEGYLGINTHEQPFHVRRRKGSEQYSVLQNKVL